MQKIRLALRGWMRRREGTAEARNAEFLRRNAGWGAPPGPAPAAAATDGTAIDLEGLQVAYLDDSGQIEHFLDMSSGEVIDVPVSDSDGIRRARNEESYRKVPGRSEESEAGDRVAFVEAMEPGPVRNDLHRALSTTDAAKEFRKLIARDRTIERAWYNFKNDRATAAIEEWLRASKDSPRPE